MVGDVMSATVPPCPACGHKQHRGECRKLGHVECRPVDTPFGTALVRGQFPCGCTHQAAPPT